MSTAAGRTLTIVGIALLGGAWILYALWSHRPESPIAAATDDRTVVAQRAGTASVSVTADHLDIDVIDQPLRAVLRQIADQTGMTLFVSDAVADALVSLRAEDLALDTGLKALLVNTDSFLLYGRTTASAQGVVGLWVYARDQGQNFAPTPVRHSSGSMEISGASAAAAAPETRARSVETLVKQRGSAAVPAVLHALEDGDALVRSRALDAALNFGLELPEDVLIHRIQVDPSPEVRFIALAGLAEAGVVNNAEVRAISELALSDPNSEVRWQAQQNLQALKSRDGVLSQSEIEESQDKEQAH